MFGFGFGFRLADGTLPRLTALWQVASAGWYASGDLITVGSSLNLSRNGFSATGAATTHSDTLKLTKRVRQVYPSHAILTANQVALSDYVYATDTVAGAVNNSTLASPKPIAAWAMFDRELVGNSVHWEIVAYHRDARPDAAGVGRQVACVQVRANDGTTQTAWQTVAATAISSIVEDAVPVPVYRGDIDITALGTGAFWLEAKVFPWFGGAASIRSSEDDATIRGFSRRWFYKDAARAAAPPLAYVSASGNDTTGVWSTNAATAAATPFLTIAKAQEAIYTQSGVTGGIADGCRIRVGAGTLVLGSPNAALKQPQTLAAMVIERDPAATRATAIVTVGAASWRPNLGVNAAGTATSFTGVSEATVLLRDLTIQRTGASAITRTTVAAISCDLSVRLHNVAFDNASQAGSLRGTGAHLGFWGATISNFAGSLLGYSALNELRMLRGVTASMANQAYEGFVMLGCALTNPGSSALADATKGCIWAHNKLLSPISTNNVVRFNGAGGQTTIGPVALVQNLIEYTATGNQPSVWISADSGIGGVEHAVIHHNTATGTEDIGRFNLFYDESAGTTRRVHSLVSFKGNIACQINTKGDIFSGLNSGLADAPNRTGQFAFTHGVGCEGNFAAYVDANGGTNDSFRQTYPGIATVIAGGSPLYVDYKGTSGTKAAPVAGAGGGDYHLQAGSPARALLAKPVLAFDMDGAARGAAAQAAGVYV